MTTLFVAGEGPHEIGKWAEEPERRSTSVRSDGVIAELFRRFSSEAKVIDGRVWRLIRKYELGGHAKADDKNLQRAALMAIECGADVLVWVRDTDNKRETHQALEAGAARLSEFIAHWVGGPAVPSIEAWGLALRTAEQKPDELSGPRLRALAEHHDLTTEQALVEAARTGPIAGTASPSLNAWLERARGVAAVLEEG